MIIYISGIGFPAILGLGFPPFWFVKWRETALVTSAQYNSTIYIYICPAGSPLQKEQETLAQLRAQRQSDEHSRNRRR